MTVDRVDHRKELPPTPEMQRGDLRAKVEDKMMKQAAREWGTVPLAQRDAYVKKMYGPGMIAKLTGFRNQALPAVDRAYAAIQARLDALNPASLERLDTICDALKEMPPEYGEEPDSTMHPYLYYETVAPLNAGPDTEPISLYKIDEAAVRQDIDSLKGMESTFLSAGLKTEAAAVGVLISQLTAYRLLDVKTAVRDYVDRYAGDSSMDIAGKKMGRIALVGILAAGTAIFGTIAFINFVKKGEISVAPFLWAFATWFVAKPDMLENLFGKDNEYKADFDQIRTVTSNDTLKTLSDRHKIGGEGWRSVVEGVYADDHAAIRHSAHPDPESLTEVVQSLTGNKTVQETLRRMIKTIDPATGKNDFMLFAEAIEGVQSDEARTFVADFFERDSFREGMKRDPRAGAKLKSLLTR